MSWFQLDKKAVLISAQVADKKQALDLASEQLSHCYGLDCEAVSACLRERERDGSTGFGRNVAIPHGKISGIDFPVVSILRIDKPIEFDSVDKQPIDIIFALLSPEGAGAAHLQALAHISRLTRNARIMKNIRGAGHPDAIYALITEELDRDAA